MHFYSDIFIRMYCDNCGSPLTFHLACKPLLKVVTCWLLGIILSLVWPKWDMLTGLSLSQTVSSSAQLYHVTWICITCWTRHGNFLPDILRLETFQKSHNVFKCSLKLVWVCGPSSISLSSGIGWFLVSYMPSQDLTSKNTSLLLYLWADLTLANTLTQWAQLMDRRFLYRTHSFLH